MCNKCEKHHISIFPNHNSIILEKDISNIKTSEVTINVTKPKAM